MKKGHMTIVLLLIFMLISMFANIFTFWLSNWGGVNVLFICYHLGYMLAYVFFGQAYGLLVVVYHRKINSGYKCTLQFSLNRVAIPALSGLTFDSIVVQDYLNYWQWLENHSIYYFWICILYFVKIYHIFWVT